jgi:DNA-binding XRE family transcriptional regulator
MSYRTYVRRNRKHWALSQDELATLLDISQSAVSRCEAGTQTPEIEVALGLQVIFGRSPRALFPDLYRKIEDRVMRHATRLDRALREKVDRCSARKRELLESMTERAAPREA